MSPPADLRPRLVGYRPRRADVEALRNGFAGLQTRRNVALWRRDPAAWLHDRMREATWSKQQEVLQSVADNSRTGVKSCHGSGKALSLTTVLPTPDGWTTMAAVQLEDWLIDEHGHPVQVINKSEVQYRPTYRVRFDDGTEIVASDDHQWQVIDLRHRPRNVADWRDHWSATVTRTTRQLAESLRVGSQLRWRVPTARPILGNPYRLPVPAYALGAWLGDGHSHTGMITVGNDDAPHLLAQLTAEGVEHRPTPSQMRDRSGAYRLVGMTSRLRGLGLIGAKHVPDLVLRADPETRLAVLQGLMDTDGWVSGGQSVGIDLCSERLADGVAALVVSLGWKAFRSQKPATLNGRVVGTVWRLNFRPDRPVFRLARKAERLGQLVNQRSRHTQRTIVAVDLVDTVPTQCVTVDSPTHLYLAGEAMVPTHNSHGASRAGLWWQDTADRPEDRFLVSTAPSWPQVKSILWRYMRQGWKAAELPGEILQTAEWKIDGEIVGYGRKPADHDEHGFQGIHAPEGVLVIVDEACGVPAQLFVAADALATNETSRVLAIGNPDDNTAHFARVCSGSDGGWNVVTISAFDTPNLTGEPVPDRMARGLVSRWWVEDKRRRWGESNPLYIAKVLGEFADAEDGLIPLSWVTAAHQRWRAWHDERAASPVLIEPAGPRTIGVDVAWRGEDLTAIAPLQGNIINPDGGVGNDKIRTMARQDSITVAEAVDAYHRERPDVTSGIDVAGGWGAGVYDQLVRKGRPVVAFNGSNRTKRRDVTGTLRFPNVRSASWWHLRELLDPAGNPTLALPPDDDLTADLTTPKWDQRAGGYVVVESKNEIKKRLGHSPDSGDAVVIACWVGGPGRGADRQQAAEAAVAEPLVAADAWAGGDDDGFDPAGGGWL